MPRVKGGTVSRNRRKRILKLSKGYYGSKHTLYKTANEQVMKSLRYAYRDRKNLKREMRKLWIARINAAARLNGMSYSKLTHGLKLAGIEMNRKMLSEVAIHDPQAFSAIAKEAQSALAGGVKKVQTEVKASAKKTAEKVETKQSTADVKVAKAPKAAVEAIDLASLKVAELRDLAKKAAIAGYSTMKKDELIAALKK